MCLTSKRLSKHILEGYFYSNNLRFPNQNPLTIYADEITSLSYQSNINRHNEKGQRRSSQNDSLQRRTVSSRKGHLLVGENTFRRITAPFRAIITYWPVKYKPRKKNKKLRSCLKANILKINRVILLSFT